MARFVLPVLALLYFPVSVLAGQREIDDLKRSLDTHRGSVADLDRQDSQRAVTDDIMTSDPNQADHSVLKFTTAPLIALPGHVAIGRQNATALLGELFQK